MFTNSFVPYNYFTTVQHISDIPIQDNLIDLTPDLVQLFVRQQ